MWTKLIKYIEEKYPGYTALPGMEHQAYTLETLMAGLTADDLEQLRAQGLILAKTPQATTPKARDLSQQGKDLREALQEKYAQGIPDKIIEETAEIIAARNNLKNPLTFLLCNCEVFLQEHLALNTPYKFNLTKELSEKENFLIISYNKRKYHLAHKLSKLLLQQITIGEHDFVFYLNAEKEIGLRVDGVDFIPPAPLAIPSQP